MPLADTACRAPSNVRTPEAINAPYSPRECPTTRSGDTPRASSILYMEVSAVSIEGWLNSVCRRVSCASLKASVPLTSSVKTKDDRGFGISSFITLSASAKTSLTIEYLSCRSLNMFRYWEPCPGNMKQTFPRSILVLSPMKMPFALRTRRAFSFIPAFFRASILPVSSSLDPATMESLYLPS